MDYATGVQPDSMASGDLNGDGSLDVVVTNNSDNTCSVLLGNGNGTLQNGVAFATGVAPSAVIIGDFNGDGRLDVAAANATDNSVSVLLQVPQVTLSSSSLTFGNQTIGSSSAAQAVTLSNTGSASLVVSIAATGDYTESNTCGTALAGGANCTISVTFTPTTTGTRNGAVNLADNGAASPQSISLTGSGIAPSVNLAPTSVSFGSQQVGTSSPSQSATLTNTGTAPLNVSSVHPSGDFAESDNCAGTVAVGASCVITLTFTPTASGTRNGSVTVPDNAPDSPQVVTLTGVGLAPAVSTSVGSLSFNNQLVGSTSAAQVITLTNTGTTTLNITGGGYLLDSPGRNT